MVKVFVKSSTFGEQKRGNMTELSEIQKLVTNDLKAVEQLFHRSIKSKVPLLDTITRYLVRKKGKQMRPLFVLLSAGMHGTITPAAHRASALIEMLHTATLIHDDVVDDAWQRRGLLSLNAVWRNKIAVLVGDFILSRGLLLALDHKEYEQLHIVSEATRQMSEGELLQIEKARRLDIDETVYYEIIRKKTASLIASCCAAGASSAGAPSDVIEQMRLFGEKAGIAFQIKDDLFEYTSGNSTGKRSGADLKEKKLTLPVIHMMRQLPASERIKLKMQLKFRKGKKGDDSIIALIQHYGGVEYATQQMYSYRSEALEILKQFSENPYGSALKNLVLFTTDRKG
jgi:octaprenyl-diphosphate synthase